MEWNEIPYSDPPSSSFTSSLSRSSSIMNENLDDSIKELSLELKKLFKAKDMVQTKLKMERKKHPVAMTVIDDVQFWFIHVDKSIKSGNILLRSKFSMKLVFWSKQQRNRDAYDTYQKKKVILELIETFLKLKNQAQDLLDRIARPPIEEELCQLKVQTSYFGLKEIKVATDNFDSKNEIGVGGFGPIYKGVLQDGTIVAVKRLFPWAWAGERVIVNEIAMLSTLQHRNIVKLLGCCIEGSELLIIYEYLENTSLHCALLGREYLRLELDWQRRCKISFDIARGLTYLHKESRLKIIHRCIAPAYILLDKHLDAKISGFDFAIFDDNIDEETIVPVGVIGYLAPEYAKSNHLTEKVDVYSYGVVLLEIISGKRCTSQNPKYDPEEDFFHLLHWARALKDRGNLLDLVDPNLGSSFSITEAEQMLNLALRCTNDDPTLRPTMSSVITMIEEMIDLATSMDGFDS